MSTRSLNSFLASILGIALIAPSVLLFVPQKTHAQIPGIPTIGVGPVEIKTSVESTISAIKSSLSWALDVTNTAAGYAQMINTYVLQPLAFVMSGNLMKMLTAGVIGFVIGKANGTGAPQFAVDVARSMQTVADGRALAYLRQVNQTKSPFAYSIRSALATDYLTKSSLAGFWAANMNTLNATSIPNYRSDYLDGNWSHGGVVAWFALTTQVQNNPYSLYQNSRSQLAGMIGSGVGGVTGAKLADINRNGGFMSWCGTSDSATQAANFSATAAQSMAATAPPKVECTANNSSFRDAPGDCYASAADAAAADQINNASETLANTGAGRTPEGGIGINPGDNCTNADGTPGTIKTPGSVIKATLDKVLGSQQNQIERMGNVGPQINQILGNIGQVISTVQFASSLLGGDKGGLLAVDSKSSARSISQLAQFTPTPIMDSKGKVIDFTTPGKDSSGKVISTSGYLGATQSSADATLTAEEAAKSSNAAEGAAEASVAATAADGDITSRITSYESAWKTIKTSTQIASTSVDSLAKFCTTAADTAALAIANATDEFGNWLMPRPVDLSKISSTFIGAARKQAADARVAIVTEIAPVFAQAATASTTIDAARVAVQKAQTDLSPTSTTNSIYLASTLALQAFPPTMTDVMNAQQKAQSYGGAKATPLGSLTVSEGSLVDQMNLINTNAQALKTTVCTPGSSYWFVDVPISG